MVHPEGGKRNSKCDSNCSNREKIQPTTTSRQWHCHAFNRRVQAELLYQADRGALVRWLYGSPMIFNVGPARECLIALGQWFPKSDLKDPQQTILWELSLDKY